MCAGVCVQAKIEDMSAQAQSAAAEQFKAPDMSEAQAATAVADAAAQPAIEEVDDDDDDAVRPHTRPPSLETVTQPLREAERAACGSGAG